MKKYSLLVLTSLMVFSSCGESTPIEAKFDEVEEITVHNDKVLNFFNSGSYDLPTGVTGVENLGDNLPIHITWSSNLENQKWNIVFEEGGNKLTYPIRGNEFDFYSYKLDTEYRVHLELDNYISDSLTFTTPIGFVRTVKVDGVPNFRDLGGNGNIDQGLIYRSMTFENNNIDLQNIHDISEAGIKELHRLGIKSEIDLRRAAERGNNYGKIEGIDYVFKPLQYNHENILTFKNSTYDNPARIKEILEYMANRNNYPMVFHCKRGADRTGCLAYIIKGLLGDTEESILKDYMFTNFYDIGGAIDFTSMLYVDTLKAEEGETLQEKIYNYLNTKLGVSTENLDSIINILKVN